MRMSETIRDALGVKTFRLNSGSLLLFAGAIRLPPDERKCKLGEFQDVLELEDELGKKGEFEKKGKLESKGNLDGKGEFEGEGQF